MTELSRLLYVFGSDSKIEVTPIKNEEQTAFGDCLPLFSSESQSAKLQLNKTVKLPALCECETWSSMFKEEHRLRVLKTVQGCNSKSKEIMYRVL